MQKAISLIGLLVITAVNAGFVFGFSFMMAGNNADAKAVYIAMAAGESFVLLYFLIALRRWWLDAPGVRIAMFTLPHLFALCMIAGVVLILLRGLGFKVG